MRRKIRIIRTEPLLLLAIPISFISLMLIFILRPFLKIRIGFLRSDRIGHFAANTELYLCDRDANKCDNNRSLDLFYFARKPCNKQLARMWARELIILPWFFMRPLDLIIRSFSCLLRFHANEGRGGGLDIDNLLEKFPAHLKFTPEEESRGKVELLNMGIKVNAPFVCLLVRDSAYLDSIYPGADVRYHDFRDSNIQNYVLAAEDLADRGYYVIRMGAKVNSTINSSHPLVIDYATNGMRNDFMDIYLGAKCAFCITTGSGWDSVPEMFRRPIVYVNYVSLVELHTFVTGSLSVTKRHVSKTTSNTLTLREILSHGVGCSLSGDEYESNDVYLIENTPEEIRDIAIEMADRLAGTWQAHPGDEVLQQCFWKIFPIDAVDANGVPMHGEIRSLYGAVFLRNNPSWLL